MGAERPLDDGRMECGRGEWGIVEEGRTESGPKDRGREALVAGPDGVT